jgi:aminopeptidase N
MFAALISASAWSEDYRGHERCASATPWYRAEAGETVHYGRGNPFDVKHTKFNLTVSFEDESIRGTVTHTFSPTGKPIDELALDSVGLDIESVELDGSAVRDFEVTDDQIKIYLANAIEPGQDADLAITYSGNELEPGLYFKTEKMGYAPDEVQLWTQGESEWSRYWFPCFDYPNDRMTTEMIVTVPDGFTALSNGRHVSTTANPNDGTSTWHWTLETDHVAYLVNLVVGHFVEIEDLSGRVPLYYYMPPRDEDHVERAYGETPDMMKFFEEYLDVPYAYGRYSQVSVVEFTSGGMENTSLTTMYEGIAFDEASGLVADRSGLVAHELIHQWFGDLLTCRDWSHLWLNEGFASYFEVLYAENVQGVDRSDYERYTGPLKSIRRVDRGDQRKPTVLSNYGHADDMFSSRIYEKGAYILHMLRAEMGDELFQKAVQTYTKRFQGRVVETHDLMRVFEEVSGLGLEQYFDQWLYHGGYPHLKVGYEWDDDMSQCKITVSQTQTVDDVTPLFAFNTKIYFKGDGFEHNEPISITEKDHEFQIKLPARPEIVCVDPNATILAEWNFKQPKNMLLAQLKDGPFIVDKIRAMEALTEEKGENVVDAIGDVLKTAEFYGLRVEAANVLGKRKEDSAALVLLNTLANEKDARVRRRIVQGLATVKSPEARQALLERIADDPSPDVKSAAVAGLAEQRWEDALPAITNMLGQDSHGDQLRIAALNALRTFGKQESLENIIPYTTGTPEQRRVVGPALRAVGGIGSMMEEQDVALNALIPALENPRSLTRIAALRALGVLGDSDAIPAIEAFTQTSKLDEEKDAARSAVSAIKNRDAQTAAIKELRKETEETTELREKLEERLEELEKRLDEIDSTDDSENEEDA